jgi:AcrR family transcriptional regulator
VTDQRDTDNSDDRPAVNVAGTRRSRRRDRAPSRPRVDRQTWVAAALAELNLHGPENLTIDRLAVQVDRTKGSFYNHFDDREDLLLATAESVLESEEQAQAGLTIESPADALCQLEQICTDSVPGTPTERALFQLTRLSLPSRVVELIAEGRHRQIRRYSTLFEACGVDRTFATDRAIAMHNALAGYQSLAMTNPELASSGTYISSLRDLLTTGVAAKA